MTKIIGFAGGAFINVDVGPDSTPDAFEFVTQSGVDRNAVILSNVVTILGLTAPAVVSIVGGEYRIDGGAWFSVDGVIAQGQQIQVRHTSSVNFFTATTTTLTIGGVLGTFTSTTRADLVGGDIIPGKDPNRGHSLKRSKLRLKREREHSESIRQIFRELTADPATRERAEAVIAPPIVERDDETPRQLAARFAQRDRALRLEKLSAEKEIALRMLHQEMVELQHQDDEQAVMQLLGMVL